jgi:hypothetical protein
MGARKKRVAKARIDNAETLIAITADKMDVHLTTAGEQKDLFKMLVCLFMSDEDSKNFFKAAIIEADGRIE